MKALAVLWTCALLWLGAGVAWEVEHRTTDRSSRAPFFICHLR